MKFHLGLCLLAGALLALALTGCGGGGGGSADTPGTTLTVFAATEYYDAMGVESRVMMEHLDEGAVVVAYNYATGEEVARGTVDTYGRCNLQITPGLTVAIVATGSRMVDSVTKSYRLSLIIPVVPQGDESYTLDPVTSMTAEALASQHPMGSGVILSSDIVDAVQAQAAGCFDDAADYSVGGGVFAAGDFGATGSVDQAELATVITAASQTIDNNIVLAKNGVQQIKEAGMPLNAMTSQEFIDADTMFWAVQSKYTALTSRCGDLLIAAISGNLLLNGQRVKISDLTMGHEYSMVINRDQGRDLTDLGAGSANEIKINYLTPVGIYTLVATRSGYNWTVTQTSSNDAQQLYRVQLPDFSDSAPSASPTLEIKASLRDSEFTTPLTFDGTVSATGADPAHYTRIVFSGTLTTQNITSSGRFEANFRSSLPANPRPYTTLINYPTSVSMTNGSISMTHEGETIRLTGAMSATAVVITGEDGYSKMQVKTFALDGTYSNSISDLAFDGEINANWTNPGDPISINELIGSVTVAGELSRTGHPTYTMNIQMALDAGDINSTVDIRVGSSTLHGTYIGTMSPDSPPYGDIVLTNQSGVKFTVNISSSHVVTGNIKVGTAQTQVATMAQSGDLMRITYATTPATYDEF